MVGCQNCGPYMSSSENTFVYYPNNIGTRKGTIVLIHKIGWKIWAFVWGSCNEDPILPARWEKCMLLGEYS